MGSEQNEVFVPVGQVWAEKASQGMFLVRNQHNGQIGQFRGTTVFSMVYPVENGYYVAMRQAPRCSVPAHSLRLADTGLPDS